MSLFDLIALDADDTLWHNERLYVAAQARFRQLLAQYHSPEWIDERLYVTEMHNLQHFGYGIKAFVLSMIETAVELTEGRITGSDIQTLIDEGRQMIGAEVELLEHVAETIPELAKTYSLMLITKGDLLDQERKLARSGLGPHFRYVEIVSDKTRETYQALLRKHSVEPKHFLMVGNSPRSDILPVLELGGYAVYIPYHTTWTHEVADAPPAGQSKYFELDHVGLLPELLERLEGRGTLG